MHNADIKTLYDLSMQCQLEFQTSTSASYSLLFGSANSHGLISIIRKEKKEEMKLEFPNGFEVFYLRNKMLKTSNINHLQTSLVQHTSHIKINTNTSHQLQLVHIFNHVNLL